MLPLPLPELGAETATFGLWHVAVGDRVLEGERIAEVWIPGAVVELVAPAVGIIREQFVRSLDPITPATILGSLEPD